jgi:hypothetical protein
MITNYMIFFLFLLTIKIILGTLESIHFLNVEQNVLKTVLSHIVSKNGIQLRWPTQTNVINLIYKSVHLYIYESLTFITFQLVNSILLLPICNFKFFRLLTMPCTCHLEILINQSYTVIIYFIALAISACRMTRIN